MKLKTGITMTTIGQTSPLAWLVGASLAEILRRIKKMVRGKKQQSESPSFARGFPMFLPETWLLNSGSITAQRKKKRPV